MKEFFRKFNIINVLFLAFTIFSLEVIIDDFSTAIIFFVVSFIAFYLIDSIFFKFHKNIQNVLYKPLILGNLILFILMLINLILKNIIGSRIRNSLVIYTLIIIAAVYFLNVLMATILSKNKSKKLILIIGFYSKNIFLVIFGFMVLTILFHGAI